MSGLPPWTDTTLVRVNKGADYDRASNGWSRYAQYVQDRERNFQGWDGEECPLEPHYFASAAWRAASPPVMAPGYVETRPDITTIALLATEEGHLSVQVSLPLRHDDLKRRLPYDWRDWERARTWGGDGAWQELTAPEDAHGQPVMLLSAYIEQVATGWTLLKPTCTSGEPLARECIAAVDMLVSQVNATVGPLVRELLGERR